MFVFVINKNGNPLMPCKPSKANHLLKEGKANVIRRLPFTIKLLFDASENIQPITGGMDTGSKKLSVSAICGMDVIYKSEVELRNDIKKKMDQRRSYRRNRRQRKTRYRPARWSNRASMRREGRLSATMQSKVQSHLREKKFVESILPISKWKVETATFDIHKLSNPDVEGKGYQEGPQKGFYNVKAYVLDRDGYKCQSKQKVKHSKILHVHHIQFRSNGGTDTPTNLITLCEACHNDLHAGNFEMKGKKSKTKHATEVSILQSILKKLWEFEETFGYETKFKREQILGLPKTHYNDAIAIACEEGEIPFDNVTVYYKKHVSKGDYQLYKGKRSEKRIPVGKLFGLRKFDFISIGNLLGFIKGKRSTGNFALCDIHGLKVTDSINIKKGVKRIMARTTTLLQEGATSSPWINPGVSVAQNR